MRRIFLFLFIICTVPHVAAAQAFSGGVNPQPSLDLQPAYPSPGEQVKISFNDYRGGAVGSEIDWFYNGNLIPDAQNKREVEVSAPEAGMTATVKMVIKIGGIGETHQAVLKPAYLDLIIEPQTHVPDFYTGRALPSIGSQINATALLNNGKQLGTNYIYTWRVNDEVVSGSGMRNQNKIQFSVPHGSAASLSLEVSDYDGTVLASRAISIPLVKPELHFYEINPLYGIETHAISTAFNLIGNGAIIRTEPFYLDSVVFNTPNVLDWTINGTKATPDSTNPYQISLARTGNPGASSLGFRVQSTTQFLQGIKGAIQINI
jgi:hypothetical protein